MFKEINGKKVRDGQTCTTDHVVTEFKVVMRSLNGVGPNDLKTLLQQKWEVVKVEQTNTDCYGRAGAPDFIGD